jgi:hypothetical protein
LPSPSGGDTSDATTPSVSPPSSPPTSTLPPLFWRSVPLLEVEPTIFRRLLHCCYTDQLPPDDAYGDSSDSSEPDHQRRIRDLVSLFAAADRFLLDHCKQLVRDKLDKTVNNSNVLAAFDHALAVAPNLARGLFLPVICANAAELLGNTDAEAEAQWLATSTAGAAAVVASNLSGLREVDLFHAVERWYRHLADDAGEEEEHEQHVERSAETKEEQVARVLAGMQYLLMSADELRDVVEKSGLVSDKELLAAYRKCALYHRMVLPCALPESTTPVTLFDRVTIRDGQMAWNAELAKCEGKYIIYINNEPQGTYSTASGKVSYAGVSFRLYLDRQCHAKKFSDGSTCAVSGGWGLYMCEPPKATPKRVLVLVHVPSIAMAPAPAGEINKN